MYKFSVPVCYNENYKYSKLYAYIYFEFRVLSIKCLHEYVFVAHILFV